MMYVILLLLLHVSTYCVVYCFSFITAVALVLQFNIAMLMYQIEEERSEKKIDKNNKIIVVLSIILYNILLLLKGGTITTITIPYLL